MLSTLIKSKYFTLGAGNGVATADAQYDDLLIYDRALSSEDVSLLYSKATRVTDFYVPVSTGVESISNGSGSKQADGIYDLSGRLLDTSKPNSLSKGIYIIMREGKSTKVLVK